MLTKIQFDVIYLLYKRGRIPQREIAEILDISLGAVNKILKQLKEAGLIDENCALTAEGKNKLDLYKVDNAIILAAGMSTRFVPVSYEFPKGLTVVKGEVLIERQIRQLHEAGVEEVVVVVGHMLEKFLYLKEKYNVKLVVNKEYKVKNTHSSVYAAREYLKSTYICCSDNYYPENLFNSHEFHSCYCAQFLKGLSRTERGLIFDKQGLITATAKPCEDMWTMQGHAFLSREFNSVFVSILEDYYDKPGTKDLYWEGIYAENLDKLPMYIVKCSQEDILEFDSVENLREFDPDYLVHNDLKLTRNICKALNAEPKEIKDITPIRAGITNSSFAFTVRGGRYVYRNPGKNTIGYIDRKREKFALETAKRLGLDSSYLYEDENEGWKISYFINITEPFDFTDDIHLQKLSSHLRTLHDSGVQCGSAFDYFEEADKLIERLRVLDYQAADEIASFRERIEALNELNKRDGWQNVLCHNDIYEPNLLISADSLYVIDWEYAGDSDKGYDISKLFTADNAPLDEIERRLAFYFGRTPTVEEKLHIMRCATVNYYYWFVWAIFQDRSGNDCSDWKLLWFEKMNKYYNEAMKLAEEV
ncbi:MAG: NTP transferase domain-containing protein [Clostridia bacterium]|nr:NTP transferase domain-containing protein [Clostridia bacterium]